MWRKEGGRGEVGRGRIGKGEETKVETDRPTDRQTDRDREEKKGEKEGKGERGSNLTSFLQFRILTEDLESLRREREDWLAVTCWTPAAFSAHLVAGQRISQLEDEKKKLSLECSDYRWTAAGLLVPPVEAFVCDLEVE